MVLRGNSKGLSTIVATLLIILLTLVAVGIIWVVVKNVLQSNSEKVSLGQFTVDLEIIHADVLNSTDIGVTVKRNPGKGELSGILFIAYDKYDSEIVKYNISMKELEKKNFKITLYVINTSVVDKISIAPIFLLDSGKELMGDIEDEYIFNENNRRIVSTPCNLSSECEDNDVCTINACSGGFCSYPAITSCVNDDGCCPRGCTSVEDNNCNVICGNGVKEGSEECDDGDTTGGDGCSSTCTVESGWTCGTQTPNVCTSGSGNNYTWTGELMINGGFESGNINNWVTPSGFYWVAGNHPDGITYVPPQSGSYAIYYNTPVSSSSSINNIIQQDVSLIAYAGYVDSGNAVITASGWGVSSEYPNHDLTKIQIIFLDISSNVMSTVLNTNYVSNGTWWKAEVVEFPVPVNARYVRMWGNTYENCVGCKSGSLDSFSVKLGYM